MAAHNQDVVEESRDPQTSRHQVRSVLFTGILIGIGIAGFLDETIFHQLRQWHTFYWSTNIRDGIVFSK